MLDELQLILEVHCEKWGVKLLEFGGESDHVHLLVEFSPTIQPSKFINNLKTVSSRLLRKMFATHLATYYWKPILWSRSYYLLSVGGAPIETLKTTYKTKTDLPNGSLLSIPHPNKFWVGNSADLLKNLIKIDTN